MDLTKRDMSLSYGGRTFAVRAYRDGNGPGGGEWHAIIIENRIPLRHGQAPTRSLAGCFAEAIRFLTGLVEAQTDAAPARP